MTLKESKFKQRGQGRIFVQCEEDIQKVRFIILELDPDEYTYLPEELITVYTNTLEDPAELVDLRKFEIDINELTEECIRNGIWIWCVGDTT